jgi:pilus assembly protein CpaB
MRPRVGRWLAKDSPMNMKALVVGVGAGLLGILLAHLYLARLEREVSGGAPVSVLVASEDLPVGTVLEQRMLAVRSLPASYVDRRHIKAGDVKSVVGVRVSTGLKASDAVLWTDLARLSQGGRELSRLVQDGMRAINIVSDHLFDGLLRPGDRVDVLFTAAEPAVGTSMLLQNLLVLSVGGSTGLDESGKNEAYTSRRAGNSVTLSVTSEQAQVITHAERRGALRLVIRNAEDIVLIEGLPTTTLDDVNRARERLSWQLGGRSSDKPLREIEHVR